MLAFGFTRSRSSGPMTDPQEFGTDEFLTVRLGAASGQPERFMLVGRPRDGLVRVREWNSNSYNTVGADFDVDPLELLSEIESVYASALEVTPEIYQIRLWLHDIGG